MHFSWEGGSHTTTAHTPLVTQSYNPTKLQGQLGNVVCVPWELECIALTLLYGESQSRFLLSRDAFMDSQRYTE